MVVSIFPTDMFLAVVYAQQWRSYELAECQ